jgi:hypothetical protein
LPERKPSAEGHNSVGLKTKAPQTPFRVTGRSVDQPLPRGLLNFKLFLDASFANGPYVRSRARPGHYEAYADVCR